MKGIENMDYIKGLRKVIGHDLIVGVGRWWKYLYC